MPANLKLREALAGTLGFLAFFGVILGVAYLQTFYPQLWKTVAAHAAGYLSAYLSAPGILIVTVLIGLMAYMYAVTFWNMIGGLIVTLLVLIGVMLLWLALIGINVWYIGSYLPDYFRVIAAAAGDATLISSFVWLLKQGSVDEGIGQQ